MGRRFLVGTMNKLCGLTLFCFTCLALSAANADSFYVRPSGTNGDGTSWAKAWVGFGNISWGTGTNQLGPGDTLCLAGGNYAQQLTIKASGTASARITIKRATASDSLCNSGIPSGADSQVILNGGGISFSGSSGTGSYVTIDGVVDSGIKVVLPLPPACTGADQYCNNQSAVGFSTSTTGVELRNLDITGPGGPNGFTSTGDLRGIDTTPAQVVTDGLLVSHCRIHGVIDGLYLGANTQNGIIEYTKIYDIIALNAVVFHENVVASVGSDNIRFRFNEVWNWNTEGIMLLGGETNWYIYGNLFHDGAPGSTARVLESQNQVNGPVYLYNNTFVNLWGGVLAGNGGSWSSGSQGRNNIYWNAGGAGLPSDDYDFKSASNSEAHGIGNGANPFVNYSGKDYGIVGTVGATFPKDKGVSLAAEFATDPNGSPRNNDSGWDIGAFEFLSGAQLPAPPKNLRVTNP